MANITAHTVNVLFANAQAAKAFYKKVLDCRFPKDGVPDKEWAEYADNELLPKKEYPKPLARFHCVFLDDGFLTRSDVQRGWIESVGLDDCRLEINYGVAWSTNTDFWKEFALSGMSKYKVVSVDGFYTAEDSSFEGNFEIDADGKYSGEETEEEE